MTSVLIFAGLLDELEQLLKGIAMMKELTFRTRDYLVSFGECMSTRVFAAYLNKIGVKARQVWKDVDGVLTCDPNIYPNARPVPHLTFEEAAELAYFGAQLLAIVSGSIMCHKFDAILLIPPPQVNISLIVNDDEAKQCVKALHSAFFENGFLSEAEEAEFSGNGTTIPSNISVM
ncbi:hypothetical protein GW17_00017566 [Ensete ventricosum]|nr:hypothetical protein GW17_00017566 [Ensete ventricosum]RZS24353.1 hypothetical protein BHM03_00057413 [Ensete ventricosum]